jgi:fructan beta-fructosidase
LTSPEFEITRDYVSFLIGGGNHPGQTGMSLLVDGRAVRTATGSDAERLAWKSWNVRDLRGKKAQLQIFDHHTGGWGHINVDHILLADAPARPATEPVLWADYAPDFYAAVAWSDIPRRDGRRIWIGWMSNWQYANDVPTTPWRNAMSLPRELYLRQTSDGPRLIQRPVKEFQKVRGKKVTLRNADAAKANEWFARHKIAGPGWEIAAEVDISSARAFSLDLLRGGNEATTLRFEPESATLTLDRTRSGRTDFHSKFSGAYSAPIRGNGRTLALRVIIDTSSIEVFAANGETVLTALVFPESGSEPFVWSAADGLRIRRLTAWKLTD